MTDREYYSVVGIVLLVFGAAMAWAYRMGRRDEAIRQRRLRALWRQQPGDEAGIDQAGGRFDDTPQP